jgi:hypothetical protein
MTRNGSFRTAFLTAGVAILAAIAAGFGVFARGDGTYVTVTSVRGEVYDLAVGGVYANNALQVVAEGIGWDVFTLVVAVPALLVASAFVARGSFRGRLVAAGMLGYFLYMYLEYAVTWALGPLFPLFIAMYAASLLGIIWIGAGVAANGVRDRFDDRFPRRSWAVLNIGMSVVLGLLWLSRITQGLTGDVAGLLHGETTMTVQALDLGLVVPLSTPIAVLVLRRQPAGLVAAAGFAVTFVALSAAITSMMISAWLVTGVLELPPILMFGVATAAGIGVSTRIYRSAIPTRPINAVKSATASPVPADVPAAAG